MDLFKPAFQFLSAPLLTPWLTMAFSYRQTECSIGSNRSCLRTGSHARRRICARPSPYCTAREGVLSNGRFTKTAVDLYIGLLKP